MTQTVDYRLAALATAGYAAVQAAIDADELSKVFAALRTLPDTGDEMRGGHRDLFTTLPAVRALAAHPGIYEWPAAVLGPKSFAVRAILFDKTPSANWKVAWHQDLTIPVRERIDLPGFGPWSAKAGIVHVQPPAAILERMLTVRIHLDSCDADNGPVRVLPGSHSSGRLGVDAIEQWKRRSEAVETHCPAGGLLLMRPLLLHASSPARTPAHRRVIHLEYAVDELPGGLEWRERWGPAGHQTRVASQG